MKNRCVQGLLLAICYSFSSIVGAINNEEMNPEIDHSWVAIEKSDQMRAMMQPSKNGRTRYRIEMEVRGNLTSLVSLLKDAKRRSDWDERIKYATILNDQSQIRQMLHVVVDAPWPEVDREMVVQEHWYQDTQSLGVHFQQTLIPNYLQPAPQRAEVAYWDAQWFLKPVGKRMIQVSAEIETDWGDLAPEWLAEYFGNHGFRDTLLAFSRESIAVYDDVRLAFVHDPNHHVPRLQRKATPGDSASEMVVER